MPGKSGFAIVMNGQVNLTSASPALVARTAIPMEFFKDKENARKMQVPANTALLGNFIDGKGKSELTHDDVIQFWFTEASPKDRWQKSDAFDDLIRTRFLATYQQAILGECYEWRATARGRLAEIIVLDQFSRNMFRDTARAFEGDGIALVLAQEAVSAGADQSLAPDERSFLYMPYMHSESLKVHEEAMRLFAADGLDDNLAFEKKHLAILEQFGRYPHRNAALGRESTEAELAFLKQPGSGF